MLKQHVVFKAIVIYGALPKIIGAIADVLKRKNNSDAYEIALFDNC
jgi:hypothetical protein